MNHNIRTWTLAAVLCGATALAVAAPTISAHAAAPTSSTTQTAATPPVTPSRMHGKFGHGRHAPGYKVTAVAGTTITATTGGPGTSATTTVTISVGSSTTITRAGVATTLSAIQPGARLQVVGTRNGNSIVATAIVIDLPQVRGTVSAISGDTITLQLPTYPARPAGAPVRTVPAGIRPNGTVIVSASTRYLNGSQTTSLGAIKTGMRIDAEGTLNSDGSLTALLVQIGTTKGLH